MERISKEKINRTKIKDDKYRKEKVHWEGFKLMRKKEGKESQEKKRDVYTL